MAKAEIIMKLRLGMDHGNTFVHCANIAYLTAINIFLNLILNSG